MWYAVARYWSADIYRFLYYRVLCYVPRRYLVHASAVWKAASRKQSRRKLKYGSGFDDKILPVYMTRWRVTTGGTAHPCVVIHGAFENRY